MADGGLDGLRSVGPATVADPTRLGITTGDQSRSAGPGELYDRLCRVTGHRHDPCAADVFAAAVAQARDPHPPAEQRDGWYWSRVRKGAR